MDITTYYQERNYIYPGSKHAKTNKMRSTKKFDNSYSRKGFRKRNSKKILEKIEATGLNKTQYKYFYTHF